MDSLTGVVRLKDIAKSAGVSTMTVSKALRDKPDIAASTRAHIQRLAREAGYVPHSAASGLRSKTTRLIGLVIPAFTDPLHGRLISAVEQNAHELGYEVILMQSMGSVEREERCVRRLMARRVDGILIAPVPRLLPHPGCYDELRQRGVPTVILGQRSPFCAAFTSVETDDLAASAAVTRHLLGLGHRRIAFLGGPSTAPWAVERLEGYLLALREAGIERDDRLIFHAGAVVDEGSRTALQFIDERSDATALQAVNDLVAIGAADTLLNQGVRIPQDLSVAGFGNVLVSEYFRVPLTTVRQPKFRIGALALDHLMRLMRGEAVETQRLSAEIVVRASTGPVRSAPAVTASGR